MRKKNYFPQGIAWFNREHGCCSKTGVSECPSSDSYPLCDSGQDNILVPDPQWEFNGEFM